MGVAGGVALRLVRLMVEPLGVGREEEHINRDTTHCGREQLAGPAAHESVGLVAKTHTTGVFEFIVTRLNGVSLAAAVELHLRHRVVEAPLLN